MKLNIAERVMAEMIEADLQQAWECLGARKFDLTIHHFQEAIRKVEEMKSISPDSTPVKQLTIDIET
jgi:hypothetical protein